MKSGFLTTSVFALILILIGSADAEEWVDPDTYDAPMGTITIDGDPDDWRFVELLTDSEFRTADDEWVTFEEYNGGIWNGPEDHTTSVAFAWDSDYLYLYTYVLDDEHEHASGTFWDGDAAQIVIADEDRAVVTQLYNYALSDNQDDIIFGNEQVTAGGLVDGDVAIVRDDDKGVTIYEARYSAEILGLKDFEAGMGIGVGVCINDGDFDTPGQKGWSGWGPHAAVFGKDANKTGLVILSSETIAVDANDKLSTTWGRIRSVQ